MKRLKHAATVAAVCGTAVFTATAAMALENEFHGMIRFKGYQSNFNNGKITEYDPAGSESKAVTSRYVEQRARIKYTGKVDNDLKLVTQFELDSRWGDSAYDTKRNKGGALGADTVNLETKHAYLDYNLPVTPVVNVKIGIQPWDDAYGGIFVDADMAGVLATTSFDKTSLALGWFRFDDKGTVAGREPRDLFVIDGKYTVAKDLKLGASYYLLNDKVALDNAVRAISKSTIHNLGLNGEFKLASATVNGFFLYQFGNFEQFGTASKNHINAFAAGTDVSVPVGPGTFKTAFLYAAGDKDAATGNVNSFQSVEDIDGGPEHDYSSDMLILRKDKIAGTTDNAIIFTMNNRDQGVIFGSLGYDVKFTDKLTLSTNAGFAAVAQENASKPLNLKTGARNDSNYLGTEMNAQIGYKLRDNLSAKLQVAYVILGDYYKGVALNGEDPDNPYTSRIVLQYTF